MKAEQPGNPRPAEPRSPDVRARTRAVIHRSVPCHVTRSSQPPHSPLRASGSPSRASRPPLHAPRGHGRPRLHDHPRQGRQEGQLAEGRVVRDHGQRQGQHPRLPPARARCQQGDHDGSRGRQEDGDRHSEEGHVHLPVRPARGRRDEGHVQGHLSDAGRGPLPGPRPVLSSTLSVLDPYSRPDRLRCGSRLSRTALATCTLLGGRDHGSRRRERIPRSPPLDTALATAGLAGRRPTSRHRSQRRRPNALDPVNRCLGGKMAPGLRCAAPARGFDVVLQSGETVATVYRVTGRRSACYPSAAASTGSVSAVAESEARDGRENPELHDARSCSPVSSATARAPIASTVKSRRYTVGHSFDFAFLAALARRASRSPRPTRRHPARRTRPPSRDGSTCPPLAASRVTHGKRDAYRGREERMKGLEPSTFAMARRRSSQLSYIRRTP